MPQFGRGQQPAAGDHDQVDGRVYRRRRDDHNVSTLRFLQHVIVFEIAELTF